jgi:hypothetical protein
VRHEFFLPGLFQLVSDSGASGACRSAVLLASAVRSSVVVADFTEGRMLFFRGQNGSSSGGGGAVCTSSSTISSIADRHPATLDRLYSGTSDRPNGRLLVRADIIFEIDVVIVRRRWRPGGSGQGRTVGAASRAHIFFRITW